VVGAECHTAAGVQEAEQRMEGEHARLVAYNAYLNVIGDPHRGRIVDLLGDSLPSLCDL